MKEAVGLFRVGVLGNCLGSLRNSMLGKLSRKKKSNSSVDFSRSYGMSFVVFGQTRSFGSNPLKQIITKTVHDAHRLRSYSGIRMDLLQHLVNEGSIRFLPFSFLFFLSSPLPFATSLAISFATSLTAALSDFLAALLVTLGAMILLVRCLSLE